MESFETSSLIESDNGTVTEASAMGQWGKFYIEGGKKLGNTFTVVEDGTQRKAMEEAGFVDIEEFNFKVSKQARPEQVTKKLKIVLSTRLRSAAGLKTRI